MSNEKLILSGAADLPTAALLEINSYPSIFQAVSRFLSNAYFKEHLLEMAASE